MNNSSDSTSSRKSSEPRERSNQLPGDAPFDRGLARSGADGGLLHQDFMARAGVLCGEMSGRDVAPFVSGLVIGTKCAKRAGMRRQEWSRDAQLLRALQEVGIFAKIKDPQQTFVSGQLRLARAKRELADVE